MEGLTLYCAGVIDLEALTCSTGWQSVVAAVPFDPSQVQPELVLAAIGSGMFVSASVFGAVWGARILLNFINR